jgi:hypothetical protein
MEYTVVLLDVDASGLDEVLAPHGFGPRHVDVGSGETRVYLTNGHLGHLFYRDLGLNDFVVEETRSGSLVLHVGDKVYPISVVS